MSDAVSALNGATFDGLVALREMGLHGMITLRGDLSDPALGQAVKAAVGQDIPAMRHINVHDDQGVAWMSPDELLLLVPYADVAARLDTLRQALAGTHALAVDVSDARALFALSGDGGAVRETIAKLCPVDMSRGAFGPGDFRRTRMAQVPAAFWMPGSDSARIICFRSVAQYAFDLLKGAAAEGSAVGYH